MKKKILAIALTFVMAAAFCACGTEKTPASADGSADAAKGSGEEVTLYLSAAASMTESMDKAIAAYEKENPGGWTTGISIQRQTDFENFMAEI